MANQSSTDVEVHGFCHPRWEPVREAFIGNFLAEGLEIGSSLALTHRGETVLDIWAGETLGKHAGPWQQDTLVLVFSTTKMATILCVLMEIDRGHLALDERITTYWPEFGQGGKEQATVRHALAHQAGVPGLTGTFPHATLGDWNRMIGLIEQEPAWFEPGSESVYHLLLYGYLLGELLYRVSGLRPREYFEQNVARIADIDFHIGLPDVHHARASNWIQPVVPDMEADWDPIAVKVQANFAENEFDWKHEHHEFITKGQVPASNGFANGRSIAEMCSIFANGGSYRGHRFLSPALIAEAAAEQFNGEDRMIGRIRYGLGFGLHSDGYAAPWPTAFHWGGFGGSWGVIEPTKQIAAGYAMNLCIEDVRVDPRQTRIWSAMTEVMNTL